MRGFFTVTALVSGIPCSPRGWCVGTEQVMLRIACTGGAITSTGNLSYFFPRRSDAPYLLRESNMQIEISEALSTPCNCSRKIGNWKWKFAQQCHKQTFFLSLCFSISVSPFLFMLLGLHFLQPFFFSFHNLYLPPFTFPVLSSTVFRFSFLSLFPHFCLPFFFLCSVLPSFFIFSHFPTPFLYLYTVYLSFPLSLRFFQPLYLFFSFVFPYAKVLRRCNF